MSNGLSFSKQDRQSSPHFGAHGFRETCERKVENVVDGSKEKVATCEAARY